LIVPMITGRKRVPAAQPLRFKSGWVALGLFALCAAAVMAAVWWLGA